jgi:hypothetical protein
MIRSILPFLFLFTTTVSAQKSSTYNYVNYRGDTIRLSTIEDPTVCDCIKKDNRNLDQKRICNRKYDYDYMTPEQQHDFDARRTICNDPKVCDCALANLDNKGLIESCDRKFDLTRYSKIEKLELLDIMAKCSESDLSYTQLIADSEKEVRICDCINLGEGSYDLKKECNERFFNEVSLTKEELAENNKLLQECVENQMFSINPTLCECQLFAKTDEDFKQACSEKFDTTKMNRPELSDFRNAMELCPVLEFYRNLNKLHDSTELSDIVATHPNSQLTVFNTKNHLEFRSEQPKALLIRKYSTDVQQKIDKTALMNICDCIHLDSAQVIQMNKCIAYFKLDLLSVEEMTSLQTIKKSCPTRPETMTICTCINTDNKNKNQEDKTKCKQLLDTLSTSELIKYINGEKSCD